MARARRRKAKDSGLRKKTLGELLRRHPGVLHALERHGVSFCAGCYLTLFSSLERAAAYHAVSDLGGFLADVREALGGRK